MTLVSIVMPMRNAEDFVDQAVASVLRETSLPLELIVVDDGSTDRSRARVEGVNDPRIRILTGPGQGFSGSINTGLAAARGDIVMQCDADDLYPADRIVTQARWLDEHPEYAAVCGAFSTIDIEGRLIANLGLTPDGGTAPLDISAELREGITRTSLCTFALRRTVLDTVGMHRAFFETSSDIDFQLRLGEAVRVCYVPRTTYFYRLHGSSITHVQGNARRLFFEAAAREFQVQRRQRGTDDLDLGTPPTPPLRHGDPPHEVAQHIQGMLLGQSWRSFERAETSTAVKSAWRAVKIGPWNPHAWKALLLIGYRTLLRALR